MAQWLDALNDAQRRAVEHGDGPLLVIAGAGTGKTRTLACRVAALVERGVAPEAILLLTFTRRAAREMLRRAGSLIGSAHAGKVWGGTFHATANRLLRQYGRSIGLAAEFTVIDQSDAADVINLVRGELGLGNAAPQRRRFPRKSTLMAIYSRMVNARMKLADLLETHYPWCADEIDRIRAVFEAYTKRKREQNVLDYDDLLLYWKALVDLPGVGDPIAGRFDHVLVDEYQDTNLVQAQILQTMRRTNGNITVVGDDAQSIYSFRAATVRNILDFPQQFPGATTITLDRNYRSTQPILDASNAVMVAAGERYTKDLHAVQAGGDKPAIVTCVDETDQCDQVCTRIIEKLEEGIPLKQQAVLFRAGHHSDALEVELTRRNVPFVKYGGLKFVEAAHVKDMIAICRLLTNPTDELSWYRVLQLLEGVGPATAQKIIGRIQDARPGTHSPLTRFVEGGLDTPPGARAEVEQFRAALADCAKIGGARPGAVIERVRRFYEPIFERLYDNPTQRLRDLDQLELIARNYRTTNAFITDLTLDPPTSTQDLAGPPLLEEDYLILSTVHSAKGCEWDVVHIIHAADGMMPSDMATGSADEIDEERRLLYVAMTRPRKALVLYFPLRYHFRKHPRGQKHSYAQLTRFIPESAYGLYHRIGAANGGETDAAIHAPTSRSAHESVDTMLTDLMS